MASIFHNHHHTTQGISLAFWFNLLFSIIEFIGGLFTNSTAILADAFHDFMDAMAIGSAVLLEKYATKKRSESFSFGYRRFSLISALLMSILLLVGSVLMCFSAYHALFNPEYVDSRGMFLLAILGILINGFAFFRLKKEQNIHEDQNHNSRAIMLHLLEDVLAWIAVLVGAVIIYFTNWYWVDAVLTFLIAGFIGYNAIFNLINTMKVMLQSVPDSININDLCTALKNINGIENIHDLHVWSLDGTYHIATVHAITNPNFENQADRILEEMQQVMFQYKIQHPTIQIETNTKNCGLSDC